MLTNCDPSWIYCQPLFPPHPPKKNTLLYLYLFNFMSWNHMGLRLSLCLCLSILFLQTPCASCSSGWFMSIPAYCFPIWLCFGFLGHLSGHLRDFSSLGKALWQRMSLGASCARLWLTCTCTFLVHGQEWKHWLGDQHNLSFTDSAKSLSKLLVPLTHPQLLHILANIWSISLLNSSYPSGCV